MTCDFCGCKLPVLVATNDRDALLDIAERSENVQDKRICLDLDDCCIYEFWRTESVQPMDRYKYLCKKCAAGLDAFGSVLLEQERRRRVLNYRNAAANVLNTMRGKEIHPYMVAMDLGTKDNAVAQVCRRDGEQGVLTNMVHGDAVGHLMTYMEDSEYVK